MKKYQKLCPRGCGRVCKRQAETCRPCWRGDMRADWPMILACPGTRREIAAKFGISMRTVADIRRRTKKEARS